jgi:hypothetical protein
LGKRGDQKHVFDMSGLDPALGRGCYTAELERASKRIGFQTGDVFYYVAVDRAVEEIEAQWKSLHTDLVKGVPSIVCMHYDTSPITTEHFRLVVGFDAKNDEVIYHEPAERDAAYRRMKRATFLSLWPLKYEAARWLVVRIRMEAGQINEAPPAAGFTNADYVQHILALRRKGGPRGGPLPERLSVLIERPFVVVGDGPREEVKAICEKTVRWAVDRLKRDFFRRDPDEIITIWLFEDDASYRANTKAIFNDELSTPYGYYSSAHRALIMNIATGTGTLVHEIVHPYVRANFPKCPAWLNEGLGSLYEQCGERDGHIVGYTNWRLAGLQRAIRAGGVPSFRALTGTTDRQFYGDDKGTNYAQARYLCYYLQEQGKLRDFYREFVANQKDDPTGYNTLVKTLSEDDMSAFQKRWETYVARLTFP